MLMEGIDGYLEHGRSKEARQGICLSFILSQAIFWSFSSMTLCPGTISS